MNFNVKLTNNSTDKILNMNLLDFFTQVTGHQLLTLVPTGVHECQADGNDADAQQKFFFYCQSQGIAMGSGGLHVELSAIPPVVGE